MAINVYSVAVALEEKGWKLLSTTYKNLNTELEMECPEGHKQFQTFKQWRAHPICEKCRAGDPFQIKNKVPEKANNIQRIIALDAATNITGFAVYDNANLVYFGIYHTDGALNATNRINQIKKWLASIINDWQPDFVGLENIQLQSFGHNNFQVETYRVLANLQGVLIDTLFENNIDHDLVSVNSWRNYCNVGEGRGRENKKKQAQDKVKEWYNIDCTQDEADAICIGKYFCHLLKNTHSSWGEEL